MDMEVTERFKQMALNYKNQNSKIIKDAQGIPAFWCTRPNDSLFNFFKPPQVQEDDKNVDDETQKLLASDFEIGHFLRPGIIPAR